MKSFINQPKTWVYGLLSEYITLFKTPDMAEERQKIEIWMKSSTAHKSQYNNALNIYLLTQNTNQLRHL